MSVSATCRVCSQLRSLGELLSIEKRNGRGGYYVCRPTVTFACFRDGVGSTASHRIAPTVEQQSTLNDLLLAKLGAKHEDSRRAKLGFDSSWTSREATRSSSEFVARDTR